MSINLGSDQAKIHGSTDSNTSKLAIGVSYASLLAIIAMLA
jgi:hypothetical protein